MKCYFDGSGGDKDPHGDEWITLGGVAGTDSVWVDFASKWDRMLKERYPVAPYIHMIELMGHDSPFDRVNGWTLQKKRQLINDAMVVLSQMNKGAFRWFRFSINETAIDRIAKDGKLIIADPYKHLALAMADFTVGSYWTNCHKPEPVSLSYDRGERFASGITREWRSRRTPNGKVRHPSNVWDRIEDISQADQSSTPPLQVADMVAWAHTRTLPTEDEREFSDLKQLLTKFVPSTNLDITEGIMRQASQMINGIRE